MSRERYLVAYDISDPVRLRRVHGTVKGFGFSLQYSVFVCDLDFMERINLRNALDDIIHASQDRTAFVHLGDPARRGESCFEFMGVHPTLARSGPTIV